MRFDWSNNPADIEIGYHTCRVVNDDGTPVNGPEIHLWDYTCPYQQKVYKRTEIENPASPLLRVQEKYSHEWSYCYGYSHTEYYAWGENLSLDDAKHLVEEYLKRWFVTSCINKQKAYESAIPAAEWSKAQGVVLPVSFESGEEMLEALDRGDLYSPSQSTYVFKYNEIGSIAVYDWIDRSKALEISALANKNDDYWGSFLGPGGEIYDDPKSDCYDTDHVSNIEWCRNHYTEEWFYTDDWYKTNIPRGE